MLSNLKKYTFLTIMFLVYAIDSIGSQYDFNFMNLSSKDGLSSNVVTAILKDRYGLIWFATDDGLNKFDGKKFTIYRHKATDNSSIISNEILDLHEDKNGNLWIGTGSGLTFYDRKKDSFINFTGNNNVAVTSLCSDNSGAIWVAGYYGIGVLNLESKVISPLPLPKPKDRLIASQPVFKVLKDYKGRIWLGTDRGLFVYDTKKNSLVSFMHSSKQPGSLPHNHINTIYEDKQRQLWVGTNNGLSKLNPDEKTFFNYTHSSANSNSLSSNIVYSLASDPDGKLWVGTEEGLSILNPLDGKVIRIKRNGRSNYSLVGKSVKSILIDKEGIHWVATFRGGINKYDKNLALFSLSQSNPNDPLGLSAPVVTSFASLDGKNVYVGTDGGGLNLFDVRKGVFKRVPLASATADLSILSMEKVGHEIWLGTYLKGLFILDSKSGAVKQVRQGVGRDYISGNDIFCIKKDSRGNVWLGTNGQGIDCYDPNTKSFTHFNNSEQGKKRIMLNGYIRSIDEDIDGNIWIGSSGSGIAVYNPLLGYSKIFNKSNSKLPSDIISSIYATKSGEIWIGTAGGGLTYYDIKKNNFITYSEELGLANGMIYKILEDDAGKLWLTTNSGVSSFDKRSKRFKNYSYHNGVQRSPFVLGAGLKLPDGRLFFGGTEGFNYFNPSQLNANKNVPTMMFTDLKVANQSVIPSDNGPIKEHISIAKEISLDYKQNFSISFTALNYTSPQENRYFYKLENFDKEWNNVGTVNTAVYTNLDPGEYVFKVKSSSDAGEWNTPVTSVKVNVLPPFWRTYYAYAFYALLVASLLLYSRYRGIQKLKSKFAFEQERVKVQQLIEQERREAERIHEFDQLKIKFLTNISHEFRTPISLIMGPVEQLLQQESNSQKTGQLQMIRRNARRLLNLVNQLLDFRNIKTQEQKLNNTEGDFVAFSRDVAESFKDLAERKHINFEFRSDVKFYFTYFDHDKVERILFNLLSNAFKFTLKEGEVLLKINYSEALSGLKVTLSDTGIGMEEPLKEKIFDRFYQGESNEAILNQGSGIGLEITKEFVRMHGGTIEVESIAVKGSVFNIYFPFKKIEDLLILEEDAVISEDTSFIEGDPVLESKSLSSDGHLPVILLVEDNEDLRFYLKDNLKKYYRVVEAGDGKEGWQKVLATHPELVVSDISMPHVSGTELCKKIKSDRRTNHIPVLLLTALTGEEDQLLGLETGANDYMTKPFNFEILNIKIRNLLTLNESLKITYSKRIKVTGTEVEITSENEKLLNKITAYVESNLTNSQLSVEDLSRQIGMSRGSLYTKVLELTGESPVEYIRSIKLEKAAILLEKSDLNISQISYSVGFATPNYFARAFKSKFSMLPSEFINLKRSDRGSPAR
jgi:ligand-binding sensor domain-containing protein/signal transduction histidine kinase/DNA-binding response OmpR family regulator